MLERSWRVPPWENYPHLVELLFRPFPVRLLYASL